MHDKEKCHYVASAIFAKRSRLDDMHPRPSTWLDANNESQMLNLRASDTGANGFYIDTPTHLKRPKQY